MSIDFDYGEKARIGRARLSDLGGRMGGRARRGSRSGRAARRVVLPRTRDDGDGDGFRTNPLTGEDDIPVTPSLPAPSEGRLRRWTPEQVEQVARMREEGKTAAEIAKELGTTPVAVRRLVHQYDLPKRNKRWTPDQVEQVVRMREEGKTATEIAAELGVSPSAIGRLAYRMGLDKLEPRVKWTPDLIEQIAQMREAGKTNAEIAEELGTTPESVRKLAQRSGLPRRTRKWTPDDVEQIARMREEGKTNVEIAKELGTTPAMVAELVGRYGLPESSRARTRKWTPEKINLVAQLREEGKTTAEIAEELGVTPSAIAQLVNRMGFARRKDPRRGRPRPKVRRWTPDKVEQIARMREAGKTNVEIAEELGTTPSVVAVLVRRRGLPKKPRGRQGPLKWTPDKIEQLTRMREAGKTAVEIAEELGTTPEMVASLASRHNLPKRPIGRPKGPPKGPSKGPKKQSELKLTPEKLEQLQQMRSEGKTQTEIAQALGVSKSAVTAAIRRENMPRQARYRRSGERYGVDPESLRSTIEDLLLNNATDNDIAQQIGMSPATVKLLVAELGLRGVRSRRGRRRQPDLTDEQLSKLIDLIEQGASDSSIAEELGMSLARATKFRRQLASRYELARPRLPQIRLLRSQGMSIREIADELGVHVSTISKMLKASGTPAGANPRARKKTGARRWTPDKLAQLAKMRSEGMTSKEIAEELGTTPEIVAKLVHQYDLPKRNKRWTPDKIEQIARMREEGKTNAEIAEELGTTPEMVANLARRYDLPKRPGGPESRKWTSDKIEQIANYGQKARLGRRKLSDIGGRLGGAVRRGGGRPPKRTKFPRTRDDGDGDGFRTNPLTGEDDIPVTPASPGIVPAPRGYRSPASRSQVRQISELHKQGLSRKEIAEQLKLPLNTVNTYLRRTGSPAREGRYISGAQYRQITELARQGMNGREIAREVELPYDKVREVMGQIGIQSVLGSQTSEKVQEMLRLRSEGKNNSEIAKILGVSRQWVIRHAAIEGIGVSTATGGASDKVIKMTPEKIALLKQLRAQGVPNDEIAKTLGVAVQTLLYVIRREGIPARKPGRRPKPKPDAT